MMEDVVSKLVRENQSAVMPRGVRSMEVERRAPACVRAGVVISASVTYGAFFLGLSVRRRIESPCGRSSRTATTERERERERERDTRGECQRRRAAVCVQQHQLVRAASAEQANVRNPLHPSNE